MVRPRVGLTFRFPGKAAPYQKALLAAGLVPVDLTPTTPDADLQGLGGLVLSGGSDIEPWRYRQPDAAAKNKDPERDEMELRLLGDALELGMPVLAICRGLQLLNVHHGGTLHQDIGELHTGVMHRVEVCEGSRLASIVGRSLDTNSRHHQAVNKAGKGLIVTARAEDGTVEGMELPGDLFVVAVQWHPEDLAEPGTPHLALFQSMASAVLHWKR